MRILYFYQYFTTPKGAWSTRAYEFARRWTDAGDTVTVVTSVYDKSDLKPQRFLSQCSIDGIDVRIINVGLSNKFGSFRRILGFVLYSLISCWYALTLPADVIVCSSGPLTVTVPGILARLIRRRPFVLEVRDLWPEGAVQLGVLRNRLLISLARRLERLSYRYASRIVVLSDGMAAWIREQHAITTTDVVPNASDNELVDRIRARCAPRREHGEQRLVVYAGTLGLMDDCQQILDMAAVLQSDQAKDIRVLIIGDGKERPQLEQRAVELQLDNVCFMGEMSREDVMAWLMRADCALVVYKNVPLLDTCSPNKLFDAFAVGLPVVQTTQGWIRRLLEAEHCGLTVPRGDPRALAHAVVTIVRDDHLRRELAANSHRVGRQMFDRSHLAAKMRQALVLGAARS